jgi:phenylacetic acid degradation operon negative regulatory protein
MTAMRNTTLDRVLGDERPLTARSVVASTLLGTQPPRMAPGRLVRVGALFGLAEGTVRTALSRMVAAGEVVQDQTGRYELHGGLRTRQVRQQQSRAGTVTPWDGAWDEAVVLADRRSADQRSALRASAQALRLAELREGVWVRPANLDPQRLPDARQVVADQCLLLRVTGDDGLASLAPRLWDLPAWARRADDLGAAMAELVDALEAGDAEALAPGFVLSAAVLRHVQADPLLPTMLLPDRWPGVALREDYERYDRAYRALLASRVLDRS